MEDLFRHYWWLMFPVFWFVFGAWHSFLNYRRHRDTVDIIRKYADSGKEPPAGLLDALNSPGPEEWRYGRRRWRRGYYAYGGWYSVVLFGSLAAGFGYASYTDLFGVGQAFVIVTFVMGSLALASLVAALTMRPPKD